MIIWWDDVTISYSMRNKWLMFFFKNFPNALLFRTLLLLLLRTSFCDILNNLRLMRAQGLLDFGRFFLPDHENLENKSNTSPTSQFVVEILELGQNGTIVSSVLTPLKDQGWNHATYLVYYWVLIEVCM